MQKNLPSKFGKRLLLFIIVGLGIFIGLSIYADSGKVVKALAEFKWGYIPLVLFVTLLNFLLRFCKWHYYLRCIGIKIKTADSLGVFLSGLTMVVTPAKLGEVVKSYLLKRINGTEVSRSIPVVFAERITDMVGLLILAAISFSVLQYGKEVLIVVLAILLALIAILQSRRICVKLLGAFKLVPVVSRLSDSLKITYETAYTLFRLKNLTVAIVLSVIAWGLECLAAYFVLDGFGVGMVILNQGSAGVYP